MDQHPTVLTTLSEILPYGRDRQDLMKIYGIGGPKYYENKPIRSWRLYTLSNVHVLETVSGEVLYMFSDVIYPLSLKLWKG
ncbi:hypothetical protein Tco_0542882 [Tanacetum coccineum]